MRSNAFLSVVYLLLLGLVSAFQYGGNHGGLAIRADTTAADKATTGAAATTAETATKTATDESATETKTGSKTDKKTESATGTQTGTETGKTTATGKGKASKTDDKNSTSTSIDPRLPAGGISMLTPSNGATTYFKIGDHVTFVWNYTSLSVTPTAVNVVASCSLNSATYTISNNMTVEQTGKVVWDTGKYQANATVPLLTATYTLIVYDAESEIGDTASPGHLSSQNQASFGMYSPQAYTPLNEYHCATCNGAFSETERQALKFAMGMVTITILSFTWFAGDFGVFAT